MSLAAERAHAARQAAEIAENERVIVPGLKVYRAQYDKIEEGTVRRVSRCDGQGTIYSERPDGKYPYFVAQFGGHGEHGGEWRGQTLQYEWHVKRSDAQRKLVYRMRDHVADLKKQIARYEGLIVQHEAEIAASGEKCELTLGY